VEWSGKTHGFFIKTFSSVREFSHGESSLNLPGFECVGVGALLSAEQFPQQFSR
jgi:hypothetical protein